VAANALAVSDILWEISELVTEGWIGVGSSNFVDRWTM